MSHLGIPSLSELLLQSVSIYLKNVSLFIRYTAWLLIPLAVTLIALSALPAHLVDILYTINNIIIESILTIWLSITFILLTWDILHNKVGDIAHGERAWKYFIPYILVSLITGFLSLVGFFLLVIPGIIIGTLFAFAPMIIIQEETRILDALKKSRDITKKHVPALAWRYYGGLCSLIALTFLVSSLVLFILFLLQGGDIVQFGAATILNDTASLIVQVLFFPLFIIFPTLLYYHVKNAKIGHV